MDTAKTSHLFQIQLEETLLSAEQTDRIASALRSAATQELLKMDFRIEALKPIDRSGVARATLSCGSGCRP